MLGKSRDNAARPDWLARFQQYGIIVENCVLSWLKHQQAQREFLPFHVWTVNGLEQPEQNPRWKYYKNSLKCYLLAGVFYYIYSQDSPECVLMNRCLEELDKNFVDAISYTERLVPLVSYLWQLPSRICFSDWVWILKIWLSQGRSGGWACPCFFFFFFFFFPPPPPPPPKKTVEGYVKYQNSMILSLNGRGGPWSKSAHR